MLPKDSAPFTFDRVVRMCLTALTLFVLYWLTRRLSGVLVPFLVSWLIAYILYPMVCFVQYKMRFKYRTLSVLAVLTFLLLVVAGILALVVPMVLEELSKLGYYATKLVEELQTNDWLPEEVREPISAWLGSVDWTSFLTVENLVTLLQRYSSHMVGFVVGTIRMFVGLGVGFICLLYVVFILIDFEKLARWPQLIPERYRALTVGIVSDLEVNMNRYFRGQSLVAFCVGILFAIGFVIMGLPLGLVVGLFIGILNLVPYLQIVGVIPCAVLGVIHSAETGMPLWEVALFILLVFVVVQAIQDFVLVPLIMGNVTGLHPAIILLALSVWGSLLGITGMIIALPLTTVVLSCYKRFVLGETTIETHS